MKRLIIMILFSIALIGPILSTSCSSSKTTTITTNSLPEGTEGVAYSQILQVHGGTPPYTWYAMATLPPGLQLDPLNGVISGTPLAGWGPAFVSFQVTDHTGMGSEKQLLITVNPTTTTTSTTTLINFNDVNTISSKSISGLSLSLYLDSKTYQQGQQVNLVVDEKNTLKTTNTITSSTKWPLSGLRVGPCGTLNYPFGIAVFQGNYTAANISSATPLQIYEPALYNCPPIITDIASYDFQPLSDSAVEFQRPESNTVFTVEMNTEFEPAPTGYWASNNVGATYTNFQPGIYTVVAGDEWGALVVVHFTVSQ